MISKTQLKERIDFGFFCAQDSFLMNGDFVPMLDIHFKDKEAETKRVIIALVGDAIEARLKTLYSLGAIFGSYKNKGSVKEMENIIMLNEVWASDEKSGLQPSKDPNKKEALVGVGQTEDGICLMKGKEIKRAMVGNRFEVQLVDWADDYSEAQSNLLSKFYEGYKGVVSKGIVFKDEDLESQPVYKSLKTIFKNS